MRKQIVQVILLSLLSVSIITACGADSRPLKGANSETERPISSNTSKIEPSPTPFQPGIEFEFPAGADTDEEAVIALVKKTMEAMVNKDKDAFRATLEFPY